MKRFARALAGALGVGLCACEAVPTLTFAQADAAPDVATDAVDAADAADADVTAVDASVEASVEGGCPGVHPPSDPFVCCGSIVCEGLCAGQCGACMSKCTSPGEFCCAKTNNVQCLSSGTTCHN